eukprot:1058043-Amphidinium_carterae.1
MQLSAEDAEVRVMRCMIVVNVLPEQLLLKAREATSSQTSAGKLHGQPKDEIDERLAEFLVSLFCLHQRSQRATIIIK